MFSTGLAHALIVALSLAPSLVSAAIFPKDSRVKMLDPKGYKKAMKANQASLVAFVAPWCGHCKMLVPEYSKAAGGLYPMVPVYAVDCDVEENKRLCAEQDVQGFPTIKFFPRGGEQGPMIYDRERKAAAIFDWTSLRIPHTVQKRSKVEDIDPWIKETLKKHRALLITKDSKLPLLWKVLSNNFRGKLDFGVHRDYDDSSFKALGLEGGSAKVLIYPSGSSKFVVYEGKTRLEPLSEFFQSVVDGTAELKSSEVSDVTAADEMAHPQKKDEL